MIELEICGRTLQYLPRTIITPDGLTISVQDHRRGFDTSTGREQDVLFIHGYSQSSLSWLKQTTGPLRNLYRLTTFDLRGHGHSDKPLGVEYYRDSRRWADEIAAVITGLGLFRPVIIGWSYAGRIILDYITHYGDEGISGLVMVAATSSMKSEMLGRSAAKIGKMASATDTAENISATSEFLNLCTSSPLPADEFALMLGFNLLTPPVIRTAMSGRNADYDEALSRIRCPILIIHGSDDSINDLKMSEHTHNICKNSSLKIYKEAGHLPFWEKSGMFNDNIVKFIDGINEYPMK